MKGFWKKPFVSDAETRRKLRLAVWSGVGIFLFIQFFQPFGEPGSDTGDVLIFHAGIGVIVFASTFIFLLLIPYLAPRLFKTGAWEEGPPDLLNLANWVLSSLGMAFYLRFVGGTSLSFLLLIRVAVVSAVSPVAVKLTFHIASLSGQLERRHAAPIHESDTPDSVRSETEQAILISADSGIESLRVDRDELLYIKAADNYVEVIDCPHGVPRSRLVRTTMRRLDDELAGVEVIHRCHRAYIVNLDAVERMERSAGGYRLCLKGSAGSIPVSRAYQIAVKTILSRIQGG